MRRILQLLLLIPTAALASVAIPSVTLAQQADAGVDNTAGRPKVVSIPNVQGPAETMFKPSGPFGVHAPSVHNPLIQSGETSTTSGRQLQQGVPPVPGVHALVTTPSTPPPQLSSQLQPACPGVGGLCQLFVVGRAGQGTVLESLRDPNNPDAPGGSFLIDLSLPPAPGVSPIPGRLNVHSTRVDRVAVAHRAVDNLWRDAPLPDIKLGINPDPGLVGMWHWFWVKNYQGEPLVFPLHLELPWTLSWQEQIAVTSMECDDDTCQMRHAVTTSHLEDHSTSYVDTIDVSVTLTPAEFRWDFGDGARGSEQPFDPVTGLGRAYTDPYAESPVRWFYEFDSRDFVGGFPVTLKGRWTGIYSIASTSTFDGPYNERGSLGGSRDGTWRARHVVCQVQALTLAPGFKPPAVPCRDPRVTP